MTFLHTVLALVGPYVAFIPAKRKPVDVTVEKPKPDSLSMGAFIAWMEQQPPEKTYRWTDSDGTCLFGQFITASGGDGFRDYVDFSQAWAKKYGQGITSRIANESPMNFGAALTRARAYAAHQSRQGE